MSGKRNAEVSSGVEAGSNTFILRRRKNTCRSDSPAGDRECVCGERMGQLYRREGISGLKKTKGRPRKSETEQAELERLRMENTLLKKFHTELRKEVLAKRNIGSSITNEKNTQ